MALLIAILQTISLISSIIVCAIGGDSPSWTAYFSQNILLVFIFWLDYMAERSKPPK